MVDAGTEGGDVPSGSFPEPSGQDAQAQSPQTGQPWRPLWIVVVNMLVFVIGAGVFFVRKKGKEDVDGGQLK